jgi:hypothetical protein
MPIQSFHTFRFQISAIQLGQWNHHYSNVNSQPSSTHHLTLTIHHPPRPWHCTSLVETRMFHNSRPVQNRMFHNTKRLYWGNQLIHEDNHIHEDSLTKLFCWQVLHGCRIFKTSRWCEVLSAGSSRWPSRDTIWVPLAEQSMSQNRSANTRSCMSWIVFKATISDFQYWQYPKMKIVKTDDKYHLRMVGRLGMSNCCPKLPGGVGHWDWASDPG